MPEEGPDRTEMQQEKFDRCTPEEGQDQTEKFDQCNSEALFRNTQKRPFHNLQYLCMAIYNHWTGLVDWTGGLTLKHFYGF